MTTLNLKNSTFLEDNFIICSVARSEEIACMVDFLRTIKAAGFLKPEGGFIQHSTTC